MGCCSSAANVPPDSPVMAEVAPPRPLIVATPTTATPLASEHSPVTVTLPPPRSRRQSSKSTHRVMEGSDPTCRDRRKSAPEHRSVPIQSPPSHRSRIRAQTLAVPGEGSHSVPRPPNLAQSKAGTRSLTSTMCQVLSNHRKFRILVLGKRGSGKTSLINTVFKSNISTGPGTDINHEIQPEDNRYLIVHEFSGFEPGDGRNFQAIRDFISYRTDPGRANDERLHAVWICLPTSDAITGSIGEGVEEILSMKRVPTVVAFTKFDQAVAIEGGSSAKSSARARVEHSCRSLFRREPRDVPAEIVSVNPQFSDLVDNLVVTLNRLIKGSCTTLAPSRSGVQGTESRIAPVHLLWSVALRVHQDIFIHGSIEVGRSRYWRELWSSQDFAGISLKDCIGVIHTDIVDVWNLKDRTRRLSDTRFREMMYHVVKDLAGPIDSVLSSPDFTEYVYRDSQENIRCVMGYIVDLTAILDDIFRIAADNVSANDIRSAMDRHVRSGRRDRIHRDINSFVTEIFGIMSTVPERDLFLEKTIDLIRQYSVPLSVGEYS